MDFRWAFIQILLFQGTNVVDINETSQVSFFFQCGPTFPNLKTVNSFSETFFNLVLNLISESFLYIIYNLS